MHRDKPEPDFTIPFVIGALAFIALGALAFYQTLVNALMPLLHLPIK